jgi:uncharacterized repeat protein (TIGR01451 family)
MRIVRATDRRLGDLEARLSLLATDQGREEILLRRDYLEQLEQRRQPLPPRTPSPVVNIVPVVTKRADPNPAYVGSELTFHITLTNEGNSTAPDVTLSDVILPDMDLVSVTATAADGSDVSERCFRDDPTPTTPNGAVGCRFGNVPRGQSATLDVVVIPGEPGAYRNHAGSGFPNPLGVTADTSRNLTHVDVTVLPTSPG